MRRQDWPERLHDYIESRRDMPFAWGKNDCAVFAAKAVEAITDMDLIGMPRWADARGALRLIESLGGMEAIADARFSRVEQAIRGDVGLVNVDGREFYGVIYRPFVITPGPKGIVMNPASDCRVTWGVR